MALNKRLYRLLRASSLSHAAATALSDPASASAPHGVGGAATTRAAVLAEVPTAAVGSTYASSAGKIYLKVANAGAAADWQLVTTTAAD